MSNFNSKTANQWIEEATEQPIPKMLFSEFWFEGEVSILFADTNLGKSILAVQIADSISKGIPIHGFKLEAVRQKALYFDFELSKKQFEARYSCEYQRHYQFDNNLIRSEINTDEFFPAKENILDNLLKEIEKQDAKVVIIDNLTFLINDIEKGTTALEFMKKLKQVKTELGLSILILAHTPKRDFASPISNNDLQGSKMLINFADSAFAIGKSYSATDLKYIKQIKQRNCEHIYNEQNVCICTITKGSHNNFLHFEFLEHGVELEHINRSKTDYVDSVQETIELKNQGLTNVDIGKRLGVSESTVRKRLSKPLIVGT